MMALSTANGDLREDARRRRGVVFRFSTLFVIEDGARAGLSLGGFESLSATAATSGNIGPGFGIVGPMESYEPFPATTKLLMVFLMWVGRLEIVPVLAHSRPYSGGERIGGLLETVRTCLLILR